MSRIILLFILIPSTLYSQTRYEAENASLTGVVVTSSGTGYSGTGYISGSSFDADTDKISFDVSVTASGEYNLKIGYRSCCGEKHQTVHVNGTSIGNIQFPNVGDFSVKDVGIINLNTGSNSIIINKYWGWMDVDYIEVTSIVNTPPVVSIISPNNGDSFVAGSNITIKANASDFNGNETISKVSFWTNNWQFLGEAFTEPYNITYNNLPEGTINLRARATDIQGGVSSDAVISINVSAPYLSETYEAEYATLTNCSAGTQTPGYSGSGHIDSRTWKWGSKVLFTVNAATTGSYNLKILYYTGYQTTQEIGINGNAIVQKVFPAVSNWTDLDFGNISLTQGNNTIIIRGQNSGWTLDAIKITGSGGSTEVPVSGASVSPTSTSISVGSTTTLTATVLPSNATNKTITWSTSNASVATVNSSGVVTALNAGNATITATTINGSITASSTILVTSSTEGNSVYNRVRKLGTNVNFSYLNVDANQAWRNQWTGAYKVFHSPNIDMTTVTNPWSTVFLDELKIYQLIRFMDWTGGNGDFTKFWTDRTQKHHQYHFGEVMGSKDPSNGNDGFSQGVVQSDGKLTTGVAYEWIIDLSNRNQSDAWLNVPAPAIAVADFPNGDDYLNEFVHKMALMFKFGVDMKDVDLKSHVGGKAHLSQLASKTETELISWGGVKTSSGLDSNLKIYIQYTNEPWLSRRPPMWYCENQSQELGFNTDQPWRWFAAWAEIRVFKAFQDVFGSEMSSRVVKTSCYDWAWPQKSEEAWQEMYVKTSTMRNSWNILPDALAWASYIGGDGTDWYTKVDTYVSNAMAHRDWVFSKGLKLIHYEGGPDFLGASNGSQLLKDFLTQPDTYDKMNYYHDKMYNDVKIDILCPYTHFNPTWGYIANVGDDQSNMYKYQAAKSFVDGVSLQPTKIATEIKEPSNSERLNWYPNPVTNGQIFIALPSNDDKVLTLSLFDMTGRMIQSQKEYANEQSEIELSVAHLKKGIYTLRLAGNKKQYTMKFQKK